MFKSISDILYHIRVYASTFCCNPLKKIFYGLGICSKTYIFQGFPKKFKSDKSGYLKGQHSAEVIHLAGNEADHLNDSGHHLLIL